MLERDMKRDYGIDLLKVVAMIMVVTHHIIMASGLESAYTGYENFILQSFHALCYCAVDCFVMATGYIMCQKEWKGRRIVKIWLRVVGYSIFLAIIGLAILPKGTLALSTWWKALFPICTNQYWFVTEYFALFFAMPYLNILLSQMNAQQSRNLLLGGFVIFCLIPFVAGIDLFVLKWGYSFVWFIYLYLCGAHLKIHGFPRGAHFLWRWGWLCAFVAGGAVLLGGFLSARYHGGARMEELGYSYASPAILLEAISLMFIFSKLTIRNEFLTKVINIVGPGTFIVFVVHANPVFRILTNWNQVFQPLRNLSVGLALSVVTGGAVCIYGGVVTVDWMRRSVQGRIFGGKH